MISIRYWPMGAILLGLSTTDAFAAEYQALENIAAESAEQSPTAIQAIDETPESLVRRGLLRGVLADASPFFRDSSLDFDMRLYDLARDDGIERIADGTAIGTELTHRSGKWRDRISTVVTWHTSFGADAVDNFGGTILLGEDQSDLSVISRAWLQYELGTTASLRLYRQDFDMPYINRNDSRMIPITHEAYMLRFPGERLQWVFGQVTKMKSRDSEDFIPMGETAGVEGSSAGTTVAGLRYDLSDRSTLGALVQHTNDLFTTVFSEASFQRTLSENWGLQLAAQLTNQWSTGEELLGDFSTYSWGLRGKASFRGAVLTAAYTKTGSAGIRSPFGGTPGFTSSMLYDFDRPREQGYRLGISQNFARFGMPGASLIVNYTKGRNAETDDGMALADADEIAITADFRPQKGILKGLWLRVRYAEGDRGSPVADRREVRIILNYSLEVFQ
jgi:hypothetical protein